MCVARSQTQKPRGVCDAMTLRATRKCVTHCGISALWPWPRKCWALVNVNINKGIHPQKRLMRFPTVTRTS